jgi:hypothetical protein
VCLSFALNSKDSSKGKQKKKIVVTLPETRARNKSHDLKMDFSEFKAPKADGNYTLK